MLQMCMTKWLRCISLDIKKIGKNEQWHHYFKYYLWYSPQFQVHYSTHIHTTLFYLQEHLSINLFYLLFFSTTTLIYYQPQMHSKHLQFTVFPNFQHTISPAIFSGTNNRIPGIPLLSLFLSITIIIHDHWLWPTSPVTALTSSSVGSNPSTLLKNVCRLTPCSDVEKMSSGIMTVIRGEIHCQIASHWR